MAGLETRDVSKHYGQTQALSSVSLSVVPGEVHGLVGHNGAGKSTLLRLLSGAERPDAGEILLDGTHLELRSPIDALDNGIACVYQELSTIDNLTVAQTLFLGRERVRDRVILRDREMEREASAYLEEFHLRISPSAKIRDLTVAQRQLVEVITALHRNARFLLLDEPTSSLEARQIDEMLAFIRGIAEARRIGVLLVDHKLDEVYAVADRVTALRNGEVVLTGPIRAISRADVMSVVIGERPGRGKASDGTGARPSLARRGHQGTGARTTSGKVVLEVRDLRSERLDGVSLVAHPGRVLGIYGLVGAGRSDFLRALYGVERIASGQVMLFGEPYHPAGPDDAISRGVAFLSEDRKLDGLIPKLTAIDNVTLPVLTRFLRASLPGPLREVGVLSRRNATEAARAMLSSVEVQGDVNAPMETLSGGNQQKALFARVVLQRPRLLLLDEPTKGVDIGAKAEIQNLVRSLVAGADAAAIVVSSEEEEILAISDDIVVFLQGTCDGTAYRPDELSPGDLRRLAWAPGR